MIKRTTTLLVMEAMLVMGLACASETPGLYFPEGNVAAGKQAVREMQCFACHVIVGSDFPAPHARPPVMVSLGAEKARQPRERLAESIIAPEHRATKALSGVTSGGTSRMGDYSEVMTVRQLIDIVAYLQSLERTASADPAP